jgi:hypothetical protein
MVSAAIFAMLLLVVMGLKEDELFLVIAVLNIFVIGSILLVEPEFMDSFKRWLKLVKRR